MNFTKEVYSVIETDIDGTTYQVNHDDIDSAVANAESVKMVDLNVEKVPIAVYKLDRIVYIDSVTTYTETLVDQDE